RRYHRTSTAPPVRAALPPLCPSSILFSPTRRPLRPPLFPYTPLFRSRRIGRGIFRRDVLDILQLRPGRQAVGLDDAGVAHSGLQDRKSTRLNSSHVKISYAVFCLKKKKEQDKGVTNNTE